MDDVPSSSISISKLQDPKENRSLKVTADSFPTHRGVCSLSGTGSKIRGASKVVSSAFWISRSDGYVDGDLTHQDGREGDQGEDSRSLLHQWILIECIKS